MLTAAKMLLVDGDEGIRQSLSLFFRSRNYHLHTAENGIQALLATTRQQFDIIICEQSLPDMNGLKFFEILNNRNYATIKVLIAVYGNPTAFENIRDNGVDYVLTKPFSGDEVETNMIGLINSRCSNRARDCPGRWNKLHVSQENRVQTGIPTLNKEEKNE
jgi:DNA-binding response OmpR family regulator